MQCTSVSIRVTRFVVISAVLILCPCNSYCTQIGSLQVNNVLQAKEFAHSCFLFLKVGERLLYMCFLISIRIVVLQYEKSVVTLWSTFL